ncbi:hypothetical protein MFIFM68171_02186 [Madurella fahalii]|uniref:Protein kinase domain-containing protein n=1 Tax=Madurella fahalii TaxID=1157608 RepID=A0ABQ0G2I1_9PEZI
MHDCDVLAVSTAHDQKNKAGSALELEHNLRWFCKATGSVALEPTLDSRETTPAEDSPSDDEKEEEEMASNVNRLVVSFSTLLALNNFENGLQLSTNPISSHILLGTAGRRESAKEVRRKETWLLAYPPGASDGFEETTIHCSSLAIRIEFPNHRIGAPRYVENLRAFVEKSRELRRGARVVKIIKARDGKAFAAKIFNPPPNRNKRLRNDPDPDWLMNIRREFATVRDNPHPNVVQVFEFREAPEPAIIMDYYPLRNITDASIAYDEVPVARKRDEKVSDKQWCSWLDEWVWLLLDRLED